MTVGMDDTGDCANTTFKGGLLILVSERAFYLRITFKLLFW